MLIVRHNQTVLLEQRPASGIWGGLWSFKEFETDTLLKQHCVQTYRADAPETLDTIHHIFSHYKLNIHPMVITLAQKPKQINDSRSIWYNLTQPESLGLPAPIKTLLTQLTQDTP